MGVSSLIEQFRKAFIKYTLALVVLFTGTALANVAYQVHLYQQQGETMIHESIDAFLTQRANANQLLVAQLLESDRLLSDFPLDRNTRHLAEKAMERELNTIDLYYLHNEWESNFTSKELSEEDFLPFLDIVSQGSIHQIGLDYYLFSMEYKDGNTMIVGEKIDAAFLTHMEEILPATITNIELNGPIQPKWDHGEFTIALKNSDATIQVTTQLDIKQYVMQSLTFPAIFFLIGALLIFRMFSNHTNRINPFLDTTRNALAEIGMGNSPSLPDTEVEEATLLYESVQSLFDQLKIKDTQVKQSHLEMIELLNAAIGTNDAYTNGHSLRVETIASQFGSFLHYQDADSMEVAARLHDIGKIGIPTQVLNKPGKLSNAEFDLIKAHPVKGAEILTRSEFFKDAVPLVLHHHEHWDGSGYPQGLKGPEIPLGAQILSLSDVYDALTSKRPYRNALSHEEALRILRDESGSTFNPVLVAQFIDFFDNRQKKKFITSLYEV